MAKLIKFFEIRAEILVPKFTRAEVRLPGIKLEIKNNTNSEFIEYKITWTATRYLFLLSLTFQSLSEKAW